MHEVKKKNPKAKKITFILDNASYYYMKDIEAYRQKLGNIEFVFLPPYSPNLNIIERIWKFFKKKILYDKYYEKFTDFSDVCLYFFKNIKKYKAELRTIATEKFHIPS
jgi:transposase